MARRRPAGTGRGAAGAGAGAGGVHITRRCPRQPQDHKYCGLFSHVRVGTPMGPTPRPRPHHRHPCPFALCPLCRVLGQKDPAAVAACCFCIFYDATQVAQIMHKPMKHATGTFANASRSRTTRPFSPAIFNFVRFSFLYYYFLLFVCRTLMKNFASGKCKQ